MDSKSKLNRGNSMGLSQDVKAASQGSIISDLKPLDSKLPKTQSKNRFSKRRSHSASSMHSLKSFGSLQKNLKTQKGFVDHVFRDPIKSIKALERSKSKVNKTCEENMRLEGQITVNLSNKGLELKTEKHDSSRNLKLEFDKSLDEDKEDSYSQKIKKRSMKVLQEVNGGRNSFDDGNKAMI